MRCRLIAALGFAFVVGCAAPRATGIDARSGSRANLALGPSATHAWLATQYTGRAEWPSVVTGQRQDDFVFYSTVLYDNQRFHDRHGSLFYENEAVRTGVYYRYPASGVR